MCKVLDSILLNRDLNQALFSEFVYQVWKLVVSSLLKKTVEMPKVVYFSVWGF